jgi:hypothetical protein
MTKKVTIITKLSYEENERLEKSGYSAKEAIISFLKHISFEQKKLELELVDVQNEIDSLEAKLKLANEKQEYLLNEV